MKTARALLLAAALLAPAAGLRAAEEFKYSKIKVGDDTVTIVTFRGQSYRAIGFDDLTDLRLAKQLVCLEGKLRSVAGAEFKLWGTDRKLRSGSAELLKKFSPGDNMWLGGRADRVGAGLNFTATVAVKLKSDLELFEERFAAANQERDWEKLLVLGEWIGKSGGYDKDIDFDELRRYNASRKQAISAACSAAEAVFEEKDAAGYCRLAQKLIDLTELEADKDLAYVYFRKAADIDPDNATAAKQLSEVGFVRFRGQWMTEDKKKKLTDEETRKDAERAVARAEQEERRAEGAANGAGLYAREKTEMEAALAALGEADAAVRLAAVLERASGARLGRRALFLAAALSPQHQAAPLAAAMGSSQSQIRTAALETAALRDDLAARKIVAGAAARDSSEEVAELACGLLADAGDRDAVSTLVTLVGAEDGFRSRAAVEALQKATGQERYTPAEWSKWWAANRNAYPPGPEE